MGSYPIVITNNHDALRYSTLKRGAVEDEVLVPVLVESPVQLDDP